MIKRIITVLLVVLVILLLGLIKYRFYFDNFIFKKQQKSILESQSYFVLNSKQQVTQGYYSQPNDQSSVKIVAKLLNIENQNKQKLITVDLSSSSSSSKLVKFLVAKSDEGFQFVLIRQKTRDFDAYSDDYIVTKPDENELVKEFENHINKLILLIIPLNQINPEDQKYSTVKQLVPAYNQYIDCNNKIFSLIKTNSIESWREDCQPRIYQSYVVD